MVTTASSLIKKLDDIYYGFVELYARHNWKLNQQQIFFITKKWLDLMVGILDNAGFELTFTITLKKINAGEKDDYAS